MSGQKRPLCTLRHTFITYKNNKNVDANIMAIYSNKSVQMVNKYYQDFADENLVKIHNKIFSGRIKSLIRKKMIQSKLFSLLYNQIN